MNVCGFDVNVEDAIVRGLVYDYQDLSEQEQVDAFQATQYTLKAQCALAKFHNDPTLMILSLNALAAVNEKEYFTSRENYNKAVVKCDIARFNFYRHLMLKEQNYKRMKEQWKHREPTEEEKQLDAEYILISSIKIKADDELRAQKERKAEEIKSMQKLEEKRKEEMDKIVEKARKEGAARLEAREKQIQRAREEERKMM
jgi:hypothetical protein